MFRRLKNLIKGFFGLFVSGLEKKNPEALLELEKENLRKQISKFNKGLASHAALAERLMSQVKQQQREKDELRAKISAYLKSDRKDIAGQFALQLKTLKKELEDNTTQLDEAEKTYQELVGARDIAVKTARTKIEELKRGITDMKMKKAVAEINEMASGLVSEIGGSGDTLNRLHEMVEEERSKAAGRARVAKDSIDTTEFKIMQDEQSALEEMALADFAAEEGIEIESTAKATPAASKAKEEKTEKKPTKKSMGPQKQAE